MARIAAMQRKELLPRDLRYIRSLKLKELPSEEQLQDIEKHLDKDAESIKVPSNRNTVVSIGMSLHLPLVRRTT